MKTTDLFRHLLSTTRGLLILWLILATAYSSLAISGTFTVTETWSVTLEYDDWAGGVFTGTKRFSGTQTGTIRIINGHYEILDRTGIKWASPGRDLKSRFLSDNGFSYDIDGDYVFAPAFGASAYGLVFLGCFAVKVQLIDGEVPAFFDYETYSSSGSDLSSISGGGNMIGLSLEAHVSSTVSLREVVGPPTIIQQPQSQMLVEGQNAIFSVSAGGKGPLTYVWRRGNTVLPGITGPSLTITNVHVSDAGSYSVIVSNAGGKVTSAIAQLTVKLPPPPWFEGWESTPVGSYVASSNSATIITGDKGRWGLVDTVSHFPDCGPTGNRGNVIFDDGRKALRLVSTQNDGGCAENVAVGINSQTSTSLPIPLLPGSPVSFFEQGSLSNPQWNGLFGCIAPPCGDTVHLKITDDHNNQVVYIFQRAANYIEHLLTNGPSNFGYVEIFLDPAGGSFVRNLYSDLGRAAGSVGVGTAIVAVEFALDSAGAALLDDLRIGAVSGTSDTTKPNLTISSPADKSRLFDPLVTLTGTARDNVAIERVEYQIGESSYQNAIGTTNWTATLELAPGTNVVRVRAKDTSGNYSTEVIRSLGYVLTSQITVRTNGSGSIAPNLDGQSLELGRNYSLTATPASGWLFSHWSGGLNSSVSKLTFAMQSNLTLQANFTDIVRPTVMISAPANKLLTTDSSLIVRGKASDNGQVTGVFFQINSESFVPAVGTTNWVATVMLMPGSNLFRVKSVDSAGNESAVVTNGYFFVVTSPLTLLTNGSGRVSGATNGQRLEVGKSYSLTATPGVGFLFSNWTGGVLSYANKLTFAMRSNLVIEANFVPNPFPAVAGNYNGLFYDPNDVLHESSGFFTATVTDKGTFTGSVQSNGRRLSLSGKFDLAGKANVMAPRTGTNALTLELRLDVVSGTDELTGTISDGTWSAVLLADRAVFNALKNPATIFTNNYTLLIPGDTNGFNGPAGDGVGSARVKPDGNVSFLGMLADGSAASQGVPLSKNGDWPLYLELYGGKGSLFGWLRVAPSSDVQIVGRVNWFRPARPTPKVSTNGFILESVVLGSVFSPIGSNRVFNLPTAQVVFAEGNLPAPFNNSVSLGPNGRVTNNGPNMLTLTVRKTGLFDGSVTPPGSSTARKFSGALLQGKGYGAGFFLGTNQSGSVYFGP